MYAHPLIHETLLRERERELGARLRQRQRNGADAGASNAFAAVVQAAAGGDARAWEAIVRRLTPVLQGIVRSYRLAPADVEDVVQTVWTSAFARIGSLRQPEAIGGWLCVIARREALHMIERRRREIPCHDLRVTEADERAELEGAALGDERRRAVHAAIERLPERQRLLVGALLRDADSSYADVSRTLGVPIGAIGPTRERALARLRRDRSVAGLAVE